MGFIFCDKAMIVNVVFSVNSVNHRGLLNLRGLCITNSMDMSLNKLREIAKDRKAWSFAVNGVTKSQT